MTEGAAGSGSPDPQLGKELLREDFSGLYQEHMKAGEDFSGRRFRIVLVVQAVPLLVVGALISKVEGADVPKLDLLSLPEPVYIVFLAAYLLGEVVREMWVRSAFLENGYARALNHFRGRYLELLGGTDGWQPWLPITARSPNIRAGGTQLALLVSVVAAINFLYLTIAVAGLLCWQRAFTLGAILISMAYGLVWFGLMKHRFKQDQLRAESRAV